ncbi:MAG: DUF1566 domain-containing protein [Planctomycetes bacterium]|nr:DUF1566 domain-containing protein [Planctomycetota bacterium]
MVLIAISFLVMSPVYPWCVPETSCQDRSGAGADRLYGQRTAGAGQISLDWVGDRLTWQDALTYCDGLVLAGRDDRRLANIRELRSIVDYGRTDPAIDPVFGALSECFCSSSTFAHEPDDAWFVHFWLGYGPHSDRDDPLYARAVRGGP